MTSQLRNRKMSAEKSLQKKKQQTLTRPNKAWRALKFAFAATVLSLTALSVLVAINAIVPLSRGHSVNLLDKVSVFLGLHEEVHTVVIDAGSTGSRVLAFTFHRSISDGRVKLDEEFFADIKPGLSSFADEPEKGARSIKELLDKAKQVIPRMKWSSTPLVLKATAGLRLLPSDKADVLLEEVRKVFQESGFLVTPKSVSIMDGIDEGLFSWFTINFLLDRLGSQSSDTVAALDLGGGSTQITFVPKERHTSEKAPTGFIHEVTALQEKLGVYSYSYLGMGLMAARKQILTATNPEDSVELRSPCVHSHTSKAWTYAGVTYTVRGARDIDVSAGRNHSADYDACLEIARSAVTESVHKPAELNAREILAISYYYDRATEHGLVDPLDGGSVTVKQLFQTARQSCVTSNADQPFSCLDMTFIASLLHHGFGLHPETTIQLKKKIDGYETSWALGAAFHILHNGI